MIEYHEVSRDAGMTKIVITFYDDKINVKNKH